MRARTRVLALAAVCGATLALMGCSEGTTGGAGGAGAEPGPGEDGSGAELAAGEDAAPWTPDAAADGPADSALPDDEGAVGPDGEQPPPDVGDPNAFAYLIVEPAALDFGTWPVGSVETRQLEIENAGNKQLTITGITWESGTGAFAANLQQLFLGPGQKKTLMVTFYALEAGVFDDTLVFDSNAANAVVLEVDVTGTAAVPACEDLDGDGHGIGCAAGPDCNESNSQVYAGAPELCNGEDDDCDGLHDEDFVGLGALCQVGFGACVSDGYKICAGDQTSLQCSVNPVTGGSELCNEVDDDCDGATDEDFPSKGKLCSVGKGACATYDKFVCNADGTALVCNVSPGEPSPEICDDGVDNDCDGIVDEGNLEVCGDGIDNDCDGETDESGSTWGEVFFARNYYGSTVAIYPSKGDGTFEDPVPLDFGDSANYAVHAVGDFDGDKYLDLVVTRTETEGESICATTADCASGYRCASGVCRLKCTLGAGGCPEGQACVDHNYNSVADDTFCVPPRSYYLAVSSCEGTQIALTELFTIDPDERLGPVLDVDLNGHLDFIGQDSWQEATGFVLLNDGTGGPDAFTKLEGSFDYGPMLAWSYALVRTSKDLTGDGVVDLLGRRFDSGGSPPTKFFLFEGQGDGTFAAAKQLGSTLPYPANLITANDFDGDGDQDIVGGLDDDGQPGGAWMLLNQDAPSGDAWTASYPIFDVVPTYNSGGEHPGVGNGTSFDFDGDDRPDVLAAWTPEECGSYVWGCTQIGDPAHLCHGGYCRKIGFIRNKTGDACLPGTSCIDGQCQAGCTPDCSGKACGSDGCGGTCGTCEGGQLCAKGSCVVDCVPQCEGKVCGDNGCGGVCGECPQGESCLEGACVAGCVPSCAGKVCGDDGCGGSCAVFAEPAIVAFDDNPATNVTAPTNVPPTPPAIAVHPVAATADDDLECAITAPSYDLDAVTYRHRWYRDGVFVKEVGAAVVPAALTLEGEVWQCRTRATDGIEWSPEVTAEATILAGEAP